MKNKTALAELIEWIEEFTEKNKQTEPIWQNANFNNKKTMNYKSWCMGLRHEQLSK